MKEAPSGDQLTKLTSVVAGKIIQVIEAMPGSVVPLAMFFSRVPLPYHFHLSVVSLPLSKSCPQDGATYIGS